MVQNKLEIKKTLEELNIFIIWGFMQCCGTGPFFPDPDPS